MRPPCELVVRFVLPAFRSLVARELIERHNLSQTAAADRLGMTQAAVSYYLDSKRGDKRMRQLETIPAVQSAAKEVAKGIASEDLSFMDSMSMFCKLCIALRRSDVICELHRDYVPLSKDCNVCPDIHYPNRSA